MKYILFILIIALQGAPLRAQDPSVQSAVLSPEQVNEQFTEPLQRELNISYPIFRAYRYTDKSGQYYCILTESRDSIFDENDTVNYRIKAIACKIEKGKLLKTWELNDFIIKNDSKVEYGIWFWTKYIDLKDYDNDSLIDPVIVYGTSGLAGSSDGRIKLLILYKGKKIAIRHQNGTLDFERETRVDKAFYQLPAALQTAIQQKMQLMVKNEHAIFPYGWQDAMKNKKTFFHER